MSLDGYVAGPKQSLEQPPGEGGLTLHDWAFTTRSFRATHGMEGGETGLDDDRVGAWNANVGPRSWGATCSARLRGAWPDDDW
jgi:hypothetical protein